MCKREHTHVRERDRETERDRERETESDREIDRERQRETERDRERQRERERERERENIVTSMVRCVRAPWVRVAGQNPRGTLHVQRYQLLETPVRTIHPRQRSYFDTPLPKC